MKKAVDPLTTLWIVRERRVDWRWAGKRNIKAKAERTTRVENRGNRSPSAFLDATNLSLGGAGIGNCQIPRVTEISARIERDVR